MLLEMDLDKVEDQFNINSNNFLSFNSIFKIVLDGNVAQGKKIYSTECTNSFL